MHNASSATVQAEGPFDPLAPRRVFTLPLDQLHPVVRIAHRLRGDLVIPERIVFDHELVLVLRGRGGILFEQRPTEFDAGDLLFIPPFRPHRIEGADVEHVAIHFDAAPHVPGAADAPQGRSPYEVCFPRGLTLPPRVRLQEGDPTWQRMLAIVELRGRGDELAEAEAVARLMQVIVALLRQGERPRDSEPVDARNRMRFDRAIAWLRENLHRDIGVEDIADAAGLSASHLRRLFPQWTGYSPNEYLRRARVERAKALMGDVDLTLKEIAARCGFNDPFQFSKVFRQVDGLPPSRFREALLAGRLDERK